MTVLQKFDNSKFLQAGNIERRLFESLVEMKTFLSQVSMHLDNTVRDKIFNQLDKICDIEQWDSIDDPIEISSFRTFIRMLFLINPKRLPGLALANEGHILAYWINNDSRLSIECLEEDSVKIVLSKKIKDNIDRAAILTTINNVDNHLSSYNPSCWFDYTPNISTESKNG